MQHRQLHSASAAKSVQHPFNARFLRFYKCLAKYALRISVCSGFIDENVGRAMGINRSPNLVLVFSIGNKHQSVHNAF